MIINVTQENIDNGERMQSELCPIALAIAKAFPDEVNIDADYGEVNISGKVYQMTNTCQIFMKSFDEGQPVIPFQFRLMRVKNVSNTNAGKR